MNSSILEKMLVSYHANYGAMPSNECGAGTRGVWVLAHFHTYVNSVTTTPSVFGSRSVQPSLEQIISCVYSSVCIQSSSTGYLMLRCLRPRQLSDIYAAWKGKFDPKLCPLHITSVRAYIWDKYTTEIGALLRTFMPSKVQK